MSTQTENGSAPLRAAARRAAVRAGVEEPLVRAVERFNHIKGGPTAWRNMREHHQVRLLVSGTLAADSDCIDIGAHDGLLLKTFVELAPRGRHIAYEPVPAVADVLAERFPDVEVRRAAVSDEAGRHDFVVHRDLPTRSSLRSVGYASEQTETISVPVERLDDALPEDFAPALVKIDVEGAEHLVLRGGMETLRRHRPLVLFEHQDSTARHYDTGPEEIYGLLTDEAGMRVFDMDGRGPYGLAEFRAVIDDGSRWNFFATAGARR